VVVGVAEAVAGQGEEQVGHVDHHHAGRPTSINEAVVAENCRLKYLHEQKFNPDSCAGEIASSAVITASEFPCRRWFLCSSMHWNKVAYSV